MRRALRATLALAALATVPLAALAEQGLYGGLAVSEVEVRPDRGPNFTPTAISGFVGKDITPHLAAELRLGVGMASDNGIEVDRIVGGYVRGNLPLARDVSLYGLLGVTNARLKYRGGGSESDTGLSYGVGVEVGLGKSVSLGLEWASLMRPSGYELESLGILAKFRF